MMLPTIFVSHGAPTLGLTDCPARHFLDGLGAELARPKAILFVSAHWEATRPTVNSVAVNSTIYDFYGFPEQLYKISYPVSGSPELALTVMGLLGQAGMVGAIDTKRGLDHGAWVPARMMYPDHDIPIVQLSVQTALGPAHHLAMGAALADLRSQGVLVVGSGSFTHDLISFPLSGGRVDAPEPDWVNIFADWFDRALIEGRTDDLLDYRQRAPEAVHNHPTQEHILPIFTALGAAGPGVKATRIHTSTTYGILRMDAYRFD